jgi:hypothetical protein
LDGKRKKKLAHLHPLDGLKDNEDRYEDKENAVGEA